MKIAVIGSKGIPAAFGGVEHVVEHLAEEFAKQGHTVTVFSRYYYSSVKMKRFRFKGFEVVNVKGITSKRFDVLSHSLISAILAALGDHDVVAFHSTVPAFFSFIPWLFGKRVFFHSHGLEVLGYKWNRVDRIVMHLLMPLTKFFVCDMSTVSIAQHKLSEKLYHRKFTVIPNGISPVAGGRCAPTKSVLFVGRLVPDKGVDILVDAFNAVTPQFPQFSLTIVGEASYSSDYFSSLGEKARKNGRITFTGAKYGEDLIQLYENAYCAVIPSRMESFSLVLLESLRYNGVVLCSDIPQLMAIAGDFALFFKSESAEDLAEKLEGLLSDSNRCGLLRTKSDSFPFGEYNWSSIARQYLDLYDGSCK